MPNSRITSSDLSVWQWNEEHGWRKSEARLEDLRTDNPTRPPSLISEDTKVYIITTSAKNIRSSRQFHQVFMDAFCIPKFWWAEHLGNANGYFGCEDTDHVGGAGFNTWAFFEVKHIARDTKYHWSKIKLFTRWLESTHQTGILLFDPTDNLSTPLFDPNLTELDDPFWMYPDILEQVVRFQEGSVWGIRDHVRDAEKEQRPADKKPKPNYRRLHDIARHAIHVTESLDVAVQNIEHLVQQHEIYIKSMQVEPQPKSHQRISRRLAFFQSYIGSIRHRSVSNQLRLQNEIQLAFNIVSQHDTSITVDISRATRSDSATMKTLAFITTTFLPPTFLCAVFSMSFFHYDAESGWGVSDKLWIYWVCIIPTIAASALLWNFWPKLFPDHFYSAFREEESTELPTFI
ncbi:hypothetical protein DTO013E5_2856 [Penicillium roqueforti]|uniref:Mg2+ transporter protein, CorA-like/Zinc transport protein ZntB n=1 Tax=Penicillium roqueforti (strain FM164) TaxID=1365484 RepID=W6QRP8_PENRF|nr:hypothetical protein DTO012A1_6259 [Penicillium roqueforti]CDM36734.1 unnamed protein product [Penicillium roqueforti FM164]KAI2749110.1 hypothetical protein DTO013F2_5891 [Penicillium roqueforti]KAI2765537.1 hypothetical protein DTO012A8_9242 [Penicillium roqueforti]KAI3082675.1 hypothetical protein CBS147339_2555 [Penicillium roqueforti]